MARVLLTLLADMVFDSAGSMKRSFTEEMDRYFERRGLSAAAARRARSAR